MQAGISAKGKTPGENFFPFAGWVLVGFLVGFLSLVLWFWFGCWFGFDFACDVSWVGYALRS
ncbi:MAG: hypothetical protein CM15mP49_29080 [Actinomycetota bacterium]|nr:MAG: hypothetical protein CM15mP49_29080 [Actinomycetota bacterium]